MTAPDDIANVAVLVELDAPTPEFELTADDDNVLDALLAEFVAAVLEIALETDCIDSVVPAVDAEDADPALVGEDVELVKAVTVVEMEDAIIELVVVEVEAGLAGLSVIDG